MRAILPGSFWLHFPSLLLLHECTVYALPTNQGEVKRDPRAAQWPFAALLLQHPCTMEAPAVDAAAVLPSPASCPMSPCSWSVTSVLPTVLNGGAGVQKIIYYWGAKNAVSLCLPASAVNLVSFSSQKVLMIATVWQAYHLHGKLLSSFEQPKMRTLK